MPNIDTLAAQPLGTVIDAIGSNDVAPGAGSAAAVGLALAAACANKAIAVTLKHQRDDAALMKARQTLTEIAHQALSGADEDAERFREFVRAQNSTSARKLITGGVRLQDLGYVLLDVLDELEDQVHSSVRGDITAARALGHAFSEIQHENLADNQAAAKRMSD